MHFLGVGVVSALCGGGVQSEQHNALTHPILTHLLDPPSYVKSPTHLSIVSNSFMWASNWVLVLENDIAFISIYILALKVFQNSYQFQF